MVDANKKDESIKHVVPVVGSIAEPVVEPIVEEEVKVKKPEAKIIVDEVKQV